MSAKKNILWTGWISELTLNYSLLFEKATPNSTVWPSRFCACFFFFFYICKDAPREGDLPSGTDFPPARQVPFLGVILNIKYFVIKSQLPTKQTLSVVLLCTCVCPDIILWPVWTCCVSISSKPTLNISNFFKISLGICPRRNTTLKCT